jgi:hypothetical protein
VFTDEFFLEDPVGADHLVFNPLRWLLTESLPEVADVDEVVVVLG